MWTLWIVCVTFCVTSTQLPKVGGSQYECKYDAAAGVDNCYEVTTETGQSEACDFTECYSDWSALVSGINQKVTEGEVLEADLHQWSRVCDYSAVERVRQCVADEQSRCTNTVEPDVKVMSTFVNFCQSGGMTVYLNLHGVQCDPETTDIFQCKNHADVQMAFTDRKINTATDQWCIFQHLFKECYQKQILYQCGQPYYDFYFLTYPWNELATKCRHLDLF